MMELTETQLKQIVQEETKNVLDEVDWAKLGRQAGKVGKFASKALVGTAKTAGAVGGALGKGVGATVGGAIKGVGKGIRGAMGPSKQQQQAAAQQAQQQGRQLVQQLGNVQFTPELIAALTQALQQSGVQTPQLGHAQESIQRQKTKKIAPTKKSAVIDV